MPRKPYFDDPKLEALGKRVYAEGFNIYSMISRLKKDMKLRVNFPDSVITETCLQFLKEKEKIRVNYAWFVRVFKQKSGEYFANQNQAYDKNKRGGFSQTISQIMKGM